MEPLLALESGNVILQKHKTHLFDMDPGFFIKIEFWPIFSSSRNSTQYFKLKFLQMGPRLSLLKVVVLYWSQFGNVKIYLFD